MPLLAPCLARIFSSKLVTSTKFKETSKLPNRPTTKFSRRTPTTRRYHSSSLPLSTFAVESLFFTIRSFFLPSTSLLLPFPLMSLIFSQRSRGRILPVSRLISCSRTSKSDGFSTPSKRIRMTPPPTNPPLPLSPRALNSIPVRPHLILPFFLDRVPHSFHFSLVFTSSPLLRVAHFFQPMVTRGTSLAEPTCSSVNFARPLMSISRYFLLDFRNRINPQQFTFFLNVVIFSMKRVFSPKCPSHFYVRPFFVIRTTRPSGAQSEYFTTS